MGIALRQRCLFDQPTRVRINLSKDHELVRLTKVLNWDELMEIAIDIREKKKNNTGCEPHYRELLGAVALMAMKKINYREAQDLITHYAPARYLCNLMDSDWAIDHVTLFDFTQVLGEDGMARINTHILKQAIEEGLADPSCLMSDTTAQEAKIPYPNEVGLMSRYTSLMGKYLKKASQKYTGIKKKLKNVKEKIKGLVRNSHLFAKTREAKRKVAKKLLYVIEDIHREIKEGLSKSTQIRGKIELEIARLTEVMEKLIPQMRHFIETGFVASKKIIHLVMTDLYAMVRGKSGKQVEFGLKWGISRIKGGFLQGFVIEGGKHLSDKRFCIDAIKNHKEIFGQSPKIYGFDRGGYSKINIQKAMKLGVKHVGISPKGKDRWAVSQILQNKIKKERAQVEAGIGNIKKPLYGFNKPDARSTKAMLTYGHRAILGFNLRKLIREQANLQMVPA